MTVPGRSRVDGLSVVVVIGTYPLVTTTFIDREIRWLREHGANIHVVAVRRPDHEARLSADQRDLAASTTYLLPTRIRSVVAAHARVIGRHPLRYLSVLTRLVSRRHPTLRARLKTVVHVSEGVVVADLLRGSRFQEYHAHFVDRAATIALVAARITGTPFSLSVHTGADLFVDPVLVGEKVRAARRVATCTEHNRERLVSLAGSETASKIAVCFHGLDLRELVPQPSSGDALPTILAVGQLTERKGLAQLVEACGVLKERGIAFRCEIVGRGPQRRALEEAIAAHGLQDRVALLGGLPHDEVVARYRSATLFALPCIRRADGDVDGIPNVLAEAMAMELPVVAGDLPAIRELVTDGEEGLLPASGDVRALADALAALLADEGRRRRLGAAGRRKVLAVFDLDRNVARSAGWLWPESFTGTPPSDPTEVAAERSAPALAVEA